MKKLKRFFCINPVYLHDHHFLSGSSGLGGWRYGCGQTGNIQADGKLAEQDGEKGRTGKNGGERTM